MVSGGASFLALVAHLGAERAPVTRESPQAETPQVLAEGGRQVCRHVGSGGKAGPLG